MTNQTPAEAVTALVGQFRWMTDPSADPIRTKVRQFVVAYIRSKGAAGAEMKEGQAAFIKAVLSDPQNWPLPDRTPERLRRLWRETFMAPDQLPSLSPPAQLIYLGLEVRYSNEIVDAALFRQFPTMTLNDVAEAHRETARFLQLEALNLSMQAAVLEAWATIEKARGRPESELLFGNCLAELALIERRDGRQFINWNNLQRVADQELRHATLAAAWGCAENAKSATESRAPN